MLTDPDLPHRNDIRRILVLRWSAMGDVVITSAVYEDIARAFPHAEIHLDTLPPWRHLFENDTRFAKLIRAAARRGGLRGTWNWLREVRANRYDLIIDLQTTDRSRLLIALLMLSGHRIPYRVGASRRFPYNIAPDVAPGPRQAIEVFRQTIAAAGIPARAERPVLHIPPENRQRAAELAAEHGLSAGHYAVFLPGSQAGGELKRWGAEHYARLATQLHDRGIDKAVLIGGPDECQRIERTCGPWLVNLCGRTELLDIAPLCEDACFIVANDTGTGHVASAAGRPMVVICGPTDPRIVKPAGDNVAALQADLPCINCYRKECSHHSCMKAITPEHVIEQLGEDTIAACGNDQGAASRTSRSP